MPRNNGPSKLDMSVVEGCEKIFLSSEVKMKVFIVRRYYTKKSQKKCKKNFRRNIARFY